MRGKGVLSVPLPYPCPKLFGILDFSSGSWTTWSRSNLQDGLLFSPQSANCTTNTRNGKCYGKIKQLGVTAFWRQLACQTFCLFSNVTFDQLKTDPPKAKRSAVEKLEAKPFPKVNTVHVTIIQIVIRKVLCLAWNIPTNNRNFSLIQQHEQMFLGVSSPNADTSLPDGILKVSGRAWKPPTQL